MLERTDRPHAPWRVVPAESKRFARVEAIRLVNEEIEAGMRRAGQEPPPRPRIPLGPVLDHEELHPLTRFRILALLAVLTAMATVFAACGGSDSSSSSSGEDPQKVLENASLEGVKSGDLDLSLHVNSEGKEGGDVEVSLSGPVRSGRQRRTAPARNERRSERLGDGRRPRLRRRPDASSPTAPSSTTKAPTTKSTRPPSASSSRRFEQAQQQEGAESGDITACQKAAEGIKFSQFADN